MSNISSSQIRNGVLAAFALLTVAFCAVIIYLGAKDIDASKRRAEVERAFMAGLLDCSGKLTAVEREFVPAASGRSGLEPAAKATAELGKAADTLIAAAQKRGDAASAEHCSEFASRAGALRSIAAALAADTKDETLAPGTSAEDVEAFWDGLFAARNDLRALMVTDMDKTELWRRQSLYFFDRLRRLVIGFSVAVTLFSLAASLLFSHTLRRGLGRLREGARAISSGDLAHSFEPIPDDEIGEVMRDFNYMVTRLAWKDEQLRAANTELREQTRLLTEANQHKDRFLANMSHELRTPLNSIIGFAELGLRDAKDENDSKRHAKVLRAAEHLLGLISGLLDVVRVDAGASKPRKEPLALDASIGEVVEMLRPLADKKNLRLSALPTGGLKLHADPKMLRQALLNLAGNAIKYTQEGFVEISGRREGDNVHITVADSGIGLSPEDQKLVFNDFHRVETGLTAHYEGAGIGLTLTKRLVELHGGWITLESQAGKGSAFTIVLPADTKKTNATEHTHVQA